MKRVQDKKSLGIMVVYRHRLSGHGVPPFTDRGFYRRLSTLGQQSGVDVIIFDPLFIDWRSSSVIGYQYRTETGRWHKVRRSIPAIVYDRCFYSGRAQYARYNMAISRIRRLPTVRFLMRGLSGKWQVQQSLSHDPQLRTYLPETHVLTDIDQVSEWLRYERSCILKPNAGSHGKKIIRVERVTDDQYVVTGRDSRNKPIYASFDALPQLLRWLTRFMGSKKYLLQRYLSLQTASGQSFDVRSLMQKSGDGCWQLTGMAVRIGRPGSLTANIHGGGKSAPLHSFLREQYDEIEVETITQELENLSQLIPQQLEREAGRFVELGIDFGVDQNGQVWILEVNSKPGRSVFAQLHDSHIRRASISNLIHYAHYLFDRQLGGLMI